MTDLRLTIAWAILVTLMIASFFVASLHEGGFVIIMLVATVKARLIVREFMEMRHFPLAWRIGFDVLIAIATAVIVGLHFFSMMERE